MPLSKPTSQPLKRILLQKENLQTFDKTWLPGRLSPPAPPLPSLSAESYEEGYQVYLSCYKRYLHALQHMKREHLALTRYDGPLEPDLSMEPKVPMKSREDPAAALRAASAHLYPQYGHQAPVQPQPVPEVAPGVFTTLPLATSTRTFSFHGSDTASITSDLPPRAAAEKRSWGAHVSREAVLHPRHHFTSGPEDLYDSERESSSRVTTPTPSEIELRPPGVVNAHDPAAVNDLDKAIKDRKRAANRRARARRALRKLEEAASLDQQKITAAKQKILLARLAHKARKVEVQMHPANASQGVADHSIGSRPPGMTPSRAKRLEKRRAARVSSDSAPAVGSG